MNQSTLRIVHLTSAHPSSDIRIFHKECKCLARAGYDVTLVAPGERDEMIDGVAVKAIPQSGSRYARMLLGPLRVLKTAWQLGPAVYHFHDPELIPVGIILRSLRRGKVIYDVHEDVPLQVLYKYWIPRFLRKPIAKCVAFAEWVCSHFVSTIVAATPSIARKFPPQKTVIVQNFPIYEEIFDVAAAPYRSRKEAIAYVGGLSKKQGFFKILEAFDLVMREMPAALLLAGDFENQLTKHRAEALPVWSRVTYLGWLDRRSVRGVLNSARLGLVVDEPLANYLEGYSTKLFEYMAAGIPVVVSNFPLWRDIVEGAGCGIAVDPLDTNAIADAVKHLLSNRDDAERMGVRGREAIVSKYNWGQEEIKLLDAYRKLLRA